MAVKHPDFCPLRATVAEKRKLALFTDVGFVWLKFTFSAAAVPYGSPWQELQNQTKLPHLRFTMKFNSRSLLGCTAFALALTAPAVQAVTYYWDNNGTTANFGTAAGTWAAPTIGSATQGWSTSTTGATLPVDVTTLAADVLNFGNGSTGLAAGPITVSGTVAANSVNFASGSGAITLNGGTIALGATGAIVAQNTGNVINSAITLSAASTVSFSLPTATAGTLTLNGQISGSYNLSFTTPNVVSGGNVQTVVLGAANTYTGNTTITTGNINNTTTIKAGVANALPSTTVLTLNGGTGAGSGRTVAYDVNGKNQTLAGLVNTTGLSLRNQRILNAPGTAATLTVNDNSNRTFSGNINGTNLSLTKGGTGTWTLSGANAYTGATQVDGGILNFSLKAAKPGSTTVTVGAAGGVGLGVRDADTAYYAATEVGDLFNTNTLAGFSLDAASGVAIDTTNAGTPFDLTVPLTAARPLTKLGTGTLILSGTNTYTGATTLSGGTLSAGVTTNLGTPASNLVFDGGTLQITGTALTSLSGIGHAVSFNAAKTVGLDIADQSNVFTVDQILNQTTAGFTKSGAGTAILSQANTYTGLTTVSAGTLTLTGNRTVVPVPTPGLDVGGAGSPLATLNLQADLAMGASQFRVGANGPGTVNQTSGTTSFTPGNQLTVGITASMPGIYNLSGGSLTIAAQANRGVILGTNANCIATFNLSGTGTLTMASGSSLQIPRCENVAASGSNGTFNQTGGSATIAELRMGGNTAVNNANQTAVLDLSAGTFSASTFTALSGGDTSNSTINLSGTAEVTLPAFPTVRGTGSTATITFNGGTLKPTAASATYMGGLTNAFIKAGGAKFDTTNGSITVTQDLLTDAVSLGGGLTKAGSNTLTLTGANTYTGATVVNGGGLTISGSGTLVGTSSLSVASGAAFRYLPTTIGGTLTLGAGSTLTLADGSALGLAWDATTANRIVVSGAASVGTGTGVLLNMGTGFTPGASYTILTAASGLDTGKYTFLNPTDYTSTVIKTATTVSLTPTAATALTGAFWRGTVTPGLTKSWAASDGSGDSNWASADGGATQALVPGPGADVVISNTIPVVAATATTLGASMTIKSLTIADTTNGLSLNADGNTLTITPDAATNGIVMHANVPASVIGANVALGADQTWTNHSANALTVSGTVSGGFALTKAGTGTVILSGVNTYSGATTVNAGTLQISGTGKLGNGTYAQPLSLGSGAILQYSSTAAQTFSGLITGAGSIVKDTGNVTTLTLNNAGNDFTGGITISSGRVGVGTAPPLSTGTITCIGNSSEGGQLFVSGTPTITNNFIISGVGYPDSNAAGPDTGRAGAIRPASGQTFTGTITLAGDSRFGVISGTASNTITGQITGPHAMDFYGGFSANSATHTFIVANVGTANDYSGNTSITAIDYSAARTGGKAILQLGASDQIPNGVGKGNLVFNGADANHIAILELNGFSETINGVANLAAAGAIIQNTATGTSTLTLGDADTTSTFSGVIADGGTGKTLDITKVGTGTLTLSGTNTYTGATTVNAGTLTLVGGSQTTPITVKTGAALGFALNSPTSTTGAVTFDTGSTVKITGAPTLASYTLMTAASFAGIAPVLHTPVPGYQLQVDGGTTLKLVQAAGYAPWAATNAPTGNVNDDYDSDGVSNGAEYVLGGTKLTKDSGKLPSISTSGGNFVFTFKRNQASIDGTTTVAIEVGTNLVTWSNSYPVPSTAVASNPGVTVVKDSPVGFDTVTLALAPTSEPLKFARLKVVVTAP